MSLGQDLDDALRMGQAALEANASSLAEIMRVLRRQPFEVAEVHYAQEAVTLWQRQGRDVVLAPLDPEYHSQPQAERNAQRARFAREGVMFLASGDLGIQMLIVKTDAGRGLLGRQKTDYSCYASFDLTSYQPVGTTSTLTGAMTKLGALYRM
jgi:hypothetical protein